MNRRLPNSMILAGTLTLSCVGTEADNPFAEPTEVTPCKSHEEYVGFDVQSVEPNAANSPAARFSTLGAALTAATEIPAWLECVDWELNADGLLSIQVFNFRGPCGVVWEGETRIEDGELVMEFENPGCATAACGNCAYDARAQIALDDAGADVLPFTLARLPCDGSNGRETEWVLPLAARPKGTSCVLADPWAAAGVSSNGAGRTDALFAECADEGAEVEPSGIEPLLTDCGEGLSCVEQRCLPACVSDEECPLGGALSCREGFCQLPL